MTKAISVYLLCVVSSLSIAAENTPEAYAYGKKLDAQQTASFYQLSLPVEVYGSVVHDDLRDVRVINAAGEEVPVLLRSEQRGVQKEKQLGLPIFPLAKARGERTGAAKIHVVTNKDGAIVNINDKQDQSAQADAVYYIIDASKADGRVHSLKLNWKSIPTGKIVAMKLSYSNDLHNWSPLNTASLSYLEFNGKQLHQDEIELPSFIGHYLKISSTEGLKNRLSSVIATISSKGTNAGPDETLTLNARLDRQTSAFTYDAGARLPVNKLNIDLGQDNAVIDFEIYGRSREADPWTQLGTYNFYHYTIQDRQTRNKDYRISPHMWRYFKLLPQQKSGTKQLPVLELSWKPHQLIFMGQGDGPFKLVYGRGDVGPMENNLSHLIDKIKPEEQKNAIALVSAGPQQILCGEPCLKVPDSPVDYTRYVLWLVVVVGSLLVLWMVVRLSREMKVE